MQVKQRYINDNLELEVEGVTYHVSVDAEGTYTHEKETRWDPEYSDFELEEVTAIWSDENDNIVTETVEMDRALRAYLETKADWE